MSNRDALARQKANVVAILAEPASVAALRDFRYVHDQFAAQQPCEQLLLKPSVILPGLTAVVINDTIDELSVGVMTNNN